MLVLVGVMVHAFVSGCIDSEPFPADAVLGCADTSACMITGSRVAEDDLPEEARRQHEDVGLRGDKVWRDVALCGSSS